MVAMPSFSIRAKRGLHYGVPVRAYYGLVNFQMSLLITRAPTGIKLGLLISSDLLSRFKQVMLYIKSA